MIITWARWTTMPPPNDARVDVCYSPTGSPATDAQPFWSGIGVVTAFPNDKSGLWWRPVTKGAPVPTGKDRDATLWHNWRVNLPDDDRRTIVVSTMGSVPRPNATPFLSGKGAGAWLRGRLGITGVTYWWRYDPDPSPKPQRLHMGQTIAECDCVHPRHCEQAGRCLAKHPDAKVGEQRDCLGRPLKPGEMYVSGPDGMGMVPITVEGVRWLVDQVTEMRKALGGGA